MAEDPKFTLFVSAGPNGWKVRLVMEELGLPYKMIVLNQSKGETKLPEHVKYNPNGRVPTLIDHSNGDFVVWESNAILTYLVEEYDPERKISVADRKDRYHQLQWLLFQASGQGPYYGQAVWLWFGHPEKVASVIDRYKDETLRVLGVLESVLSKQDWLVGGKCTIADISFIPWNVWAFKLIVRDYKGFNLEKDFPAVNRWHAAMAARGPIRKVLDELDASWTYK